MKTLTLTRANRVKIAKMIEYIKIAGTLLGILACAGIALFLLWAFMWAAYYAGIPM